MTPPVAPQSKSFWPYLLTIIVTAVIVAGLTLWLTKPADDSAATPTVATPASTAVTAAQAEVAVQKTITDPAVHIRYDHMSTDNTKYIVQAYNDMGDHITTVNWYRVEKATGAVSIIDIVAGETE